MKKEYIEKKSQECTERLANIAYAGGGHIGQDDLQEAFIIGANWCINSVWHDASEKPDISKEIIVIYPDKSCRVFRPNGVWKTLIKVDKFIKWAYIEDLLPNVED